MSPLRVLLLCAFATASDPQHMKPFAEQQVWHRAAGGRRLTHNQRRLATTTTVPYASTHPFVAQDATSGTWAPLRIVAYYDESLFASSLTLAKKNYLKNELLPGALQWWADSLDVVRVEGNLKLGRFCNQVWTDGTCAGYDTTDRCGSTPQDPTIPTSHFQDSTYQDMNYKSYTIAGGSGVANADFILYVTAEETAACSSSTLAYAGMCKQDQWDRPIAGRANFCPNELDTSTGAWDKMIGTAIHEIGHALGFSSSSFAFFRNTNGTPMTPRDSSGSPQNGQTIATCTSGSAMTPAQYTSSYPIPSTNTLLFVQERGGMVAKVVTPKVLQVVRNYFDCPSLNGAELENQPTSTDDCFGSHWEERLFNTEVMSSTTDPFANHYSPMTLALLEDSGWYKAKYTRSTSPFWGKHAGCAFATEKCVTAGTTPKHPFCQTPQENHCTSDFLYRAYCAMATYTGSLPSGMQYFTDPAVGGDMKEADYCPYYQPYSNGDCTSTANSNPNGNDHVYGMKFGSTSRCMLTSLVKYGWSASNPQSGCFKHECTGDSKVIIIVTTSKDGGTTNRFTCDSDGQTHTVPGYSGVVTCPPAAVLCGNPCPNQCTGRGNCADGVCSCIGGFGGDDCSKQKCDNDCSGHGTCNLSTFVCDCESGWNGDLCNQPPSPAPTAMPTASPTPVVIKLVAYRMKLTLDSSTSAATGTNVECRCVEALKAVGAAAATALGVQTWQVKVKVVASTGDESTRGPCTSGTTNLGSVGSGTSCSSSSSTTSSSARRRSVLEQPWATDAMVEAAGVEEDIVARMHVAAGAATAATVVGSGAGQRGRTLAAGDGLTVEIEVSVETEAQATTVEEATKGAGAGTAQSSAYQAQFATAMATELTSATVTVQEVNYEGTAAAPADPNAPTPAPTEAEEESFFDKYPWIKNWKYQAAFWGAVLLLGCTVGYCCRRSDSKKSKGERQRRQAEQEAQAQQQHRRMQQQQRQMGGGMRQQQQAINQHRQQAPIPIGSLDQVAAQHQRGGSGPRRQMPPMPLHPPSAPAAREDYEMQLAMQMSQASYNNERVRYGGQQQSPPHNVVRPQYANQQQQAVVYGAPRHLEV